MISEKSNSDMKKTRIIYYLAGALALAGCEKSIETTPESTDVQSITFVAEKPSIDDATKTEWTGEKVVWSESDKIRVSCLRDGTYWQALAGDASESGAKMYLSKPLASSCDIAKFTFDPGSFFKFGSQGEYQFFAISPSTLATDASFENAPFYSASLLTSQNLSTSTFDAAADILVGKSTSTYTSAITSDTEVAMVFKRLVAISEITFKNLKNAAQDEVVKEITLTAQEGAKISGDITINVLNGSISADSAINNVNVKNTKGIALTNGSITAWFSTLEFTASSLDIEIVTDKFTYHRLIDLSSNEKTFARNKRNILVINMGTDDTTKEEVVGTVTPGTYSITPNNQFWGTTYSGSFTTTANSIDITGTQDNVTIEMKNGTSTNGYINANQTRVYNGYTMKFSVPSGYNITGISFTADGSNWAGSHTADVGTMTNNKTWTGTSNSVTISFKGTCRVTGISVTYESEGSQTDPVVEIPAPILSIAAGSYVGSQTVKVSNYNTDYMYAYTIDGTDPAFNDELDVTNGTNYDNASGITISSSCTLKILAIDEDSNKSDVVSAAYVIEPSIANTAETAYTTAQAIALINSGSSQLTSTEVYVKGTISKVVSFNETYGSITYWLDDDAFEIYGGLDENGSKFTSINDLQVGDKVVVIGKIKSFTSDGNTVFEMTSNGKIVSNDKVARKVIPSLQLGDYKTTLSVNAKDEYSVTYNGDATVIVKSSDESVAEAVISDGKVTISAKKAGTTTISISVAETDNYYAGSAEYSLIVTSGYSSEAITLSSGTYSGANTTGQIVWNGTSASVTQTKGNSSTNVSSSYVSNPRWYQSHVVSFAANTTSDTKEYTIVGAIVVCTTSAYATALANSTYSNGASASASESTVTITSTGDFSVTMGAQSRISSVTILYTEKAKEASE